MCVRVGSLAEGRGVSLGGGVGARVQPKVGVEGGAVWWGESPSPPPPSPEPGPGAPAAANRESRCGPSASPPCTASPGESERVTVENTAVRKLLSYVWLHQSFGAFVLAQY